MISTNKSPLTQNDRELISKVVNHSDFPQQVTTNQVITIHIVDDTVWVKLFRCWVAFDCAKRTSEADRDWFRSQVAELKPEPLAIAA